MHQTLQNLTSPLEALGAAFSQVAKVKRYITDFRHFDRYDAAHRELFKLGARLVREMLRSRLKLSLPWTERPAKLVQRSSRTAAFRVHREGSGPVTSCLWAATCRAMPSGHSLCFTRSYPACATVIAGLTQERMVVEIEAIATLGASRDAVAVTGPTS